MGSFVDRIRKKLGLDPIKKTTDTGNVPNEIITNRMEEGFRKPRDPWSPDVDWPKEARHPVSGKLMKSSKAYKDHIKQHYPKTLWKQHGVMEEGVLAELSMRRVARWLGSTDYDAGPHSATQARMKARRVARAKIGVSKDKAKVSATEEIITNCMEEAVAPHHALIKKLTSISKGHVQAQHQLENDPDVHRITEHGELKTRKDIGEHCLGSDSDCHWNVGKLHKSGHVDHVVVGYAKGPGGWHQHTWGEKAGKVVETTHSNIHNTHYFGAKLSHKESSAFAHHVSRPENKPGNGNVRTKQGGSIDDMVRRHKGLSENLFLEISDATKNSYKTKAKFSKALDDATVAHDTKQHEAGADKDTISRDMRAKSIKTASERSRKRAAGLKRLGEGSLVDEVKSIMEGKASNPDK